MWEFNEIQKLRRKIDKIYQKISDLIPPIINAIRDDFEETFNMEVSLMDFGMEVQAMAINTTTDKKAKNHILRNGDWMLEVKLDTSINYDEFKPKLQQWFDRVIEDYLTEDSI